MDNQFLGKVGDADKASENIDLLLARSTLPNLFDNHPPFQIDGNFGGTAAIANMLLQSTPGSIHILPALPVKWSSGEVIGLKAKGGLTVGVEWKDGELVRVSVASERGYEGKVIYRGSEVPLSVATGAAVRLDKNLCVTGDK